MGSFYRPRSACKCINSVQIPYSCAPSRIFFVAFGHNRYQRWEFQELEGDAKSDC